VAFEGRDDLGVELPHHDHGVDLNGFPVGVAASETLGGDHKLLGLTQLGSDFGYFNASSVYEDQSMGGNGGRDVVDDGFGNPVFQHVSASFRHNQHGTSHGVESKIC
jgi:hypothetical protein